MAGTARFHQQAHNYQDEFVKTLEEDYYLKVNQKTEHETSMGGVLQKMKSWKPGSDQSPTK